MSTELRTVTPAITQTRFSGGTRGVCVQVTQRGLSPTATGNPLGMGYLQFTRTDAALLAAELLRFAAGEEMVNGS